MGILGALASVEKKLEGGEVMFNILKQPKVTETGDDYILVEDFGEALPGADYQIRIDSRPHPKESYTCLMIKVSSSRIGRLMPRGMRGVVCKRIAYGEKSNMTFVPMEGICNLGEMCWHRYWYEKAFSMIEEKKEK